MSSVVTIREHVQGIQGLLGGKVSADNYLKKVTASRDRAVGEIEESYRLGQSPSNQIIEYAKGLEQDVVDCEGGVYLGAPTLNK